MTTSANGTVAADCTPWAGPFPMDAATPITTVHLGIEYHGEVVRTAQLTRSRGRDWSVIGRDAAESKPGTPKPTGSITGSSMTLCPNARLA